MSFLTTKGNLFLSLSFPPDHHDMVFVRFLRSFFHSQSAPCETIKASSRSDKVAEKTIEEMNPSMDPPPESWEVNLFLRFCEP